MIPAVRCVSATTLRPTPSVVKRCTPSTDPGTPRRTPAPGPGPGGATRPAGIGQHARAGAVGRTHSAVGVQGRDRRLEAVRSDQLADDESLVDVATRRGESGGVSGLKFCVVELAAKPTRGRGVECAADREDGA